MNPYKCYQCGSNLEPFNGKVPFKATCDKCLAYLHSCKNCKYYQPGLPNDCRVPGTDPIADRTAANYCDEFEMLGVFETKNTEQFKNKFNSLFKDDNG